MNHTGVDPAAGVAALLPEEDCECGSSTKRPNHFFEKLLHFC